MKIKDALDLPMLGKGDETCDVIASLPMPKKLKERLYRLKTEGGMNWCEWARRILLAELPAVEKQLGLKPHGESK